MFFTEYNPMMTEEVNAKLAAQMKPANAGKVDFPESCFSLNLTGDFAPKELRYEILDAETLKVTENGVSCTVPYGAVALGRIIILSHQLPDCSRGFHTVIDTCNNSVTAFETWYGITVPVGYNLERTRPATHTRDIPREVQRHYYFGWLDTGDNVCPKDLHTQTNRIEGRGLHWTYENGHSRLTFFPGVASCVLVELGDALGDIAMANPADYIRIDDRYYIFSRSEAELGGKLWIEVMDFFNKEAAGLEYGFDAQDCLDYTFHSAKLTITGDAAHLEAITDYGIAGTPTTTYNAKGQRFVYRPRDIDLPMTKEEARAHAKESCRIFDRGGTNIMASGNGLPESEFLVGKQFKIKLDGEKHSIAPWAGENGDIYEYDVFSKDLLRFRINGDEWKEAKYKCFEPAQDICFFSHMIPGDPDYANLSQAIDFSTGLATTIRAQIGNWHSEWEIGSCAKFGVLEYGDIVPPFARRHHFSNDLLGRCYAYSYRETMNSFHIYTGPESYSWTIVQKDNSGGTSWTSPCYIIKLRNDAYILEWVEENCNGMMGLVMINPEILHDGGFFFGVSHEGLSLNTTGAYMRYLGTYDIAKYFSK